VLGNYGGDDERVDATIPPAQKALEKLGRTYEPQLYEGAGHGFLRQQDGKDGANMKATRAAWPRSIAFLKKHLE
jgi:carboxymethylenebutenolidase